MFVADAGQDGGDGAVLPVEFLATLRTVPGDGGQVALDRRNAVRLPAVRRCANGTARCTGCDVEADDQRIRGKGR